MTDEEYVSREVAELLKEKGFDWDCNVKHYYLDDVYDEESPFGIYAPTQAMAMRWLRKIKGIDIQIIPISVEGGRKYGSFIWKHTWSAETDEGIDSFTRNEAKCLSYEEAVNKALKHALKHMVDIPFDKNIVAFND